METLIGFISFFAMLFGIFYLFLTTRNRERMALIEKGADASLFNTGREKIKFLNWNKLPLKIGMFLIGIGLGLIAGAILDSLDIMRRGPDYLSMIFIFGGLSLVLFYVFARDKQQA
ncbi:MAG: DUF6249 domain-containing protein [Bacteroidales bacterium]